MPGIAGVIGVVGAAPGEARQAMVQRMVGTMRHESFYQSGGFGDDRAGIVAGWTSRGDGPSSANPHWNVARTICLIVDGENFDDAAPAGSNKPQDCMQHVLRGYEKQDIGFLSQLNGTLNGVLLDLRQQKVILFNDRFGLGRMHVHERDGEVHFSSEAKALLAVLPHTRQIDAAALAEYASCGCVMRHRSLFTGVQVLPPASCWTFVAGRLQSKSSYFNTSAWEQLPRLSAAEFQAQLTETFARVLPKYAAGQAKVGVSLTGGLDGRMIMAGLASSAAANSLPCYTFGGPYRDCSDVTLARQVAQLCGQTHQVIPVGQHFLQEFPAMAERAIYISDGEMDASGSVELYANRFARQIAPIRLTGNYGSEVLRHNVAFKAQPLSQDLFNPGFVELGKQAAVAYADEAKVRRLSLIVGKQVPWHHHARLSVEQSQVTMRSPYLDNALVALAYQAPLGAEASTMPALRFVQDKSPSLARIATDRGLKVQPVPLWTQLHHLAQEFTFRAEYAYDYGMPQWLARVDHVARHLHLERLFLGRHKFYHFRIWYRDALGPYLRDLLLNARAQSRPHVQPGALARLVHQHLAGTHNHTSELHQAVSIELMYQQFIERDWR
jgi:asparagine synthase (glutamine-hydrolysing)